MILNSQNARARQQGRSRLFIPILLGLAGVLIVAMVAIKLRSARPAAQTSAQAPAVTEAAPAPAESAPEDVRVVIPLAPPPQSSTSTTPAVPSRPTAAEAAAVPARPVPSAETRQMVQALTQLNPGGAPLSAEQVAAWKQNLQALVQQGAAGIPAIREFLETSKDVSFGAADMSAVGFESVRGALFDALRQIGGPEGVQATLDTLGTTADPREILALARNLESMAPGEHRSEMLEATRQALAMAQAGQLQGYDVGPLFEVFQRYGGNQSLPDLEQALTQWKYYAAIGLVNLPEGTGIPSLIQVANGTSGNRGIALEMLAQVSTQYPEARTALLDQVRNGKIPPNLWPYLGSVLGGDYYQLPDALWFAAQNGSEIYRQKAAHVGFGNQNFYQGPVPGGVSPDELNRQIALVDELSGATSDPAAAQALARAKTALTQRLGNLTAPAQP